jgi:hypothetical protein
MALDDLLVKLERRDSAPLVTLVTPAGVQRKPLRHKACTLVTRVTPENGNTGSMASKVGAGDAAASFDDELFQERAAIYEFDAGFTREEAERRAYLEVMKCRHELH